MARLGINVVKQHTQNWATASVRTIRNLTQRSAFMLALLLSLPLLVGVHLVTADADQNSTTQGSTHNGSDISVSSDVSVDPPAATVETGESRVHVNSSTQTGNNSGSQVRVRGSVSATTEDGTTKTETFDKTYTSTSGNTSNSFNVNINTNVSSDAEVKIRSTSDSDVDVDIEDDSEVRIRD
jgi:hypothetical protein